MCGSPNDCASSRDTCITHGTGCFPKTVGVHVVYEDDTSTRKYVVQMGEYTCQDDSLPSLDETFEHIYNHINIHCWKDNEPPKRTENARGELTNDTIEKDIEPKTTTEPALLEQLKSNGETLRTKEQIINDLYQNKTKSEIIQIHHIIVQNTLKTIKKMKWDQQQKHIKEEYEKLVDEREEILKEQESISSIIRLADPLQQLGNIQMGESPAILLVNPGTFKNLFRRRPKKVPWDTLLIKVGVQEGKESDEIGFRFRG